MTAHTWSPASPEHNIQCPHCGAPLGIRCTTPRGRKLAIPSHDARITAWRTLAANHDPLTGEPHP